jgi:hypothetical protein
MREYRRNIQSTVAKAVSIGTELPILFKNDDISNNWNKFLQLYHSAWYKLSRENLTEKELNEMLNNATPYIDNAMRSAYNELGYTEREQGSNISTNQAATGDIVQNRTISNISVPQTASGPIVKPQILQRQDSFNSDNK